jgi:hypothetical protein
VRRAAGPRRLPAAPPAAIAVVYLADPHSDEQIAARIAAVAHAIRVALGG